MQFKSLLLAACAATSTLALPASLFTRQTCTTTMYGSPGTVTFKGFSDEPGAATCNEFPRPAPGTPVVRLPAAYMNAAGENRCGTNVTVYFTPVVSGGLTTPPSLTSVLATVYGTCVSCESWEAEGSPEIFDQVWPDGDSAKGTWGPSIVFN